MDLDDYPLLNEPNVMLVALHLARDDSVLPEHCVDELLNLVQRTGGTPPDDLGPLRRRVATAFRYLCVAGLLDPDEEGRCVITERGRTTLKNHPAGVDASVLVAFSEFRAYIAKDGRIVQEHREGAQTVEPKASYDAGYSDYLLGHGISDNPHEPDTIAHLEWENGWSEAEEESRNQDPVRGTGTPK